MPRGLALFARRGIAAFRLTRIAKAHGHKRDGIGIVEPVLVDAQPVSQSISAVIVPWDAARMDLGSGSLADDEDA